MTATQRYELIRPILFGEKTVREVHAETDVPPSTIYHYLKRFRESHQQIESLTDRSRAPHSNPNWFTEEQTAQVVNYKLLNLEKSARQIAKELTEKEILKINSHTVADILSQYHLTAKIF